MTTNNKEIIREKYKSLERIYEFITYFVVLVGLVVIQFPLPFMLEKNSTYIIAGLLFVFTLIWHRFLPEKYSGLKKNYIESIIGLIAVFFLVNLTGGIRSYFSFLYFLPILSNSIHVPFRLLISLSIFTSVLIIFPLLTRSDPTEFLVTLSYTALQVWAVWLITAYGRFLGNEIKFAKNKEEEIKVEEMREVEKLKDEFLFIVSHELRSPISVIRGYLEILTTESSKKVNSKLKEILDKAFITSNQLASLVSLLLEAARIETENIHFFTQDVYVKKIVDKVKRNLSVEIKIRSTDFKMSINDNLMVNIDEERLEEILNIVVGNAVKYTPEFRKIEVSAMKLDNFVKIKVKDSGVGMTREQKGNLFDKFYITKTTGGESTIKGINIGLYVVKQLLLRMGGNIVVQSSVGEGTTFTLTIPEAKNLK